jgi:hypothetical protein
VSRFDDDQPAAASGPEVIDGDMTARDIADTLQRIRFRNGPRVIALGDEHVRDFLVAAVLARRGTSDLPPEERRYFLTARRRGRLRKEDPCFTAVDLNQTSRAFRGALFFLVSTAFYGRFNEGELKMEDTGDSDFARRGLQSNSRRCW